MLLLKSEAELADYRLMHIFPDYLKISIQIQNWLSVNSLCVCVFILFIAEHGGYWRQWADERFGDPPPKVDPGAFGGQR